LIRQQNTLRKTTLSNRPSSNFDCNAQG
jgi:hypothetical protein